MVERKSELEFESELVDYIAKIGGTRQWQKVELHTNEELWANFKKFSNRIIRINWKNRCLIRNLNRSKPQLQS